MLYHIVCPAKFRKMIFTDSVAQTVKQVCMDIGMRYEIYIVEIGTDDDHVHFLVQSVPMMLPTRIVQTIKSITAKQVLDHHPEIQKILWGGKFWTSGYYINTVGAYGNERVIAQYVKNQGKTYTQIHRDQLMIFEGVE